MNILWMPYFRVAWPDTGPRQLALGKATLFDDNEDSWRETLGSPRPEFLQIFREFPYSVGQGEPPPAHGSLVTAGDPDWLRQCAEEVVASIYWFCDTPTIPIAAEVFQYYCFAFRRGHVGPQDGVNLHSKYMRNMESTQSIRIFPPLATRGQAGAHKLDLASSHAGTLLSLLDHDPQDRRVVAVRHYFRTHFSESFLGSPASDIAAHCAAIEAALGLDARRDGQQRFVDALIDRYGEEGGRREFFAGLYVARSLYVHGHHPTEVEDAGAGYSSNHHAFATTPWRDRIQRALSRDSIVYGLSRSDCTRLSDSTLEAGQLLTVALRSTAIWNATKALLTKRKAADAIIDMNDTEFSTLESLCSDLDRNFAWSCVREKVTEDTLRSAITTCILVVCRSADSTPETKSLAESLGHALDNRDHAAIESWSWATDNGWRIGQECIRSRVWTIKEILARLVHWFEPDHGSWRDSYGG